MKKIILALSIVLMAGAFNTLSSQVNININVNSQPAWGPSGYDYAEYYYFPDINVYFDVNNSLFYYLSKSSWISNRYLPDKYSKYDLYNLYKVVVNDSKPWSNNSKHKKEYSNYKGNKKQPNIKNSNDQKYSQSKNNTLAWTNKNQSDNKGNNNKNQNNNKQTNNSNKQNNKNQNKDQDKKTNNRNNSHNR